MDEFSYNARIVKKFGGRDPLSVPDRYSIIDI